MCTCAIMYTRRQHLAATPRSDAPYGKFRKSITSPPPRICNSDSCPARRKVGEHNNKKTCKCRIVMRSNRVAAARRVFIRNGQNEIRTIMPPSLSRFSLCAFPAQCRRERQGEQMIYRPPSLPPSFPSKCNVNAYFDCGSRLGQVAKYYCNTELHIIKTILKACARAPA